jgi:transcription elongation factor Elf1
MFRCPRCRRFFNLSTSISSYSIKQRIACIHCGLGIGAPHD